MLFRSSVAHDQGSNSRTHVMESCFLSAAHIPLDHDVGSLLAGASRASGASMPPDLATRVPLYGRSGLNHSRVATQAPTPLLGSNTGALPSNSSAAKPINYISVSTLLVWVLVTVYMCWDILLDVLSWLTNQNKQGSARVSMNTACLQRTKPTV